MAAKAYPPLNLKQDKHQGSSRRKPPKLTEHAIACQARREGKTREDIKERIQQFREEWREKSARHGVMDADQWARNMAILAISSMTLEAVVRIGTIIFKFIR